MKIPVIVTLCHLFFLAAFLYTHPPKQKKNLHRPVTIHTHLLQEKKPVSAAPSVQKTPPPKKTPEKPQPKPQTISKQSPKPQKDPNREKLISMMQESLHTLNTPSAAESTSVSKVGKLASEALSFESTYQQELMVYLESLLTLPEKGDVKIKLTLLRNGAVQKVEILKTTSERNRYYVESTLPTLSLPVFGKNFKGETTHSFLVTLTTHENSR